jgi:hypothetical protein
MKKLVEPSYKKRAGDNVDLAYSAWFKDRSPVRGKRLFEYSRYERPIHAVVANQNEGLVAVLLEYMTQSVPGTSDKLLKRFPVWKSGELRSFVPTLVRVREGASDFFVGFPLPVAVVEVVESFQNLAGDPISAGNCSPVATHRCKGLVYTTLGRQPPAMRAAVGTSSRPRKRRGVIPSTCP